MPSNDWLEGSGHEHEGGPIVLRRSERLLDTPRGHPPQQVEHGTRLVVGPARACPTEGLLTNDRPGGLVVDVEVSRRLPESLARFDDRRPVLGEYRTGEGVGTRGIDQRERL